MQSFDMATKERQEEFEKLQVRRVMISSSLSVLCRCAFISGIFGGVNSMSLDTSRPPELKPAEYC